MIEQTVMKNQPSQWKNQSLWPEMPRSLNSRLYVKKHGPSATELQQALVCKLSQDA
ncbi:Uncharacterised protein [Chlamydia abortus]|nr:Uncharacterised protein [Chlamydia abortus]